MRVVLFASLALAATSLSAAAVAGPDAIVKDGVEVTILPSVAPFSGRESEVEVALDVEITGDAAAHKFGFRSLRGVTDIDCSQGANRFVRAEAYDALYLKGASRAWPVSGHWVQPTSESYMSQVTQRVCHGASQPVGPAIAVTSAVAPPAPMSPTPVAMTPPPQVVRVPPEARAPAPRAAAPRKVAVLSTPTVPQAEPPATGKPGATAVAQVAASPTAKGAQRTLDALKSLIAPPLAGAVESATVSGVQIFRASVTGFASPADARAFCAKATAVTKACWVRRDAPTSAAAPDHRQQRAAARVSASGAGA